MRWWSARWREQSARFEEWGRTETPPFRAGGAKPGTLIFTEAERRSMRDGSPDLERMSERLSAWSEESGDASLSGSPCSSPNELRR